MPLKIEYVKTDSIKPYAGNAKTHPAEQIEQIKQSIEEFGFNDPIGVWHDEVVEGHGRLIAAVELGMKKVPVIRLDELTDDKRRAYTLVHNKLTLNSGFDTDLLELELLALPDIDMDKYGFNIDDFMPGDDDGGYYGDERERTNDAYNLGLAHETELTNDFWQMPIIAREDYIPQRLIGFNYAKTSKDKNCGIHFFVDDYQFERVWTSPEKYVGILEKYQCILSPDFSLYMDMPMPMKIWNIYRSRQIGAYYQRQGITVIPTLSWAEPDTFRFCFQGIERGSVVAVSTVGVKRNAEARQIWTQGMDAALDAIKPSAVLLYGGALDYDFKGVKTVEYKNEVTEDWKDGR